jgi:hypothetical protein
MSTEDGEDYALDEDEPESSYPFSWRLPGSDPTPAKEARCHFAHGKVRLLLASNWKG